MNLSVLSGPSLVSIYWLSSVEFVYVGDMFECSTSYNRIHITHFSINYQLIVRESYTHYVLVMWLLP